MKKTLCVFLALFLTLSLLSVPALADGEDSSFEPVTVADDESVKVVVTDLVSSPEDSFASFTLEITNKTEMGLEFSLTAFSANDRMCPLSWINGPDSWTEAIDIPSGETRSVSAGWDKSSLAQVGVNYVQSAEGYLSAKWSDDYTGERIKEAGDDVEAQDTIYGQSVNFELLFPITLPIPTVDMDTPATEDVIYDTDFAPVTIVDDEGVTAVIHDYYFNHNHLSEYSDEEIGHSLVISIENRTGSMLRLNLQGSVDGNLASINSSQRLPTGKTLIEPVSYYVWDVDDIAELASANTLHLSFALLDENYVVYGNYLTELDLDISPYGDTTSSVYGTAAWVADPTPPETPQPTEEPVEEPVEEDLPPAEAENTDLRWVPDPETDANAMVALGDNGEYLIGMTYDESFPAIMLYFKNNSNNATDSYIQNVTVNGSSFPYSFVVFSSDTIVQPGGATNYSIIEQETAFPSGGFDTEIELLFIGEDSNILLASTVTVSFAEDGSATIEQVS